MLDIKRILATEIREGALSPKQAEYLLKKFLLQKGIYKEFVEQYLLYQTQRYGMLCESKKAIEKAVSTLAHGRKPFYDIIQRYDTAFNWSKTPQGRDFWLDIHKKWMDITSNGFLSSFYVENS